MKKKQLVTVCGLVMVLAISACSARVERNPDGSLAVESSMTEADLQTEIEAAIADSLVHDFSVDLHDGYIAVSAQRDRVSGSGTDTLSFRLDLGVSEGHLSATVSDAQLNGRAFEQARIDNWNERIANHLERAAQRRPNSTLQTVTIGGDSVTLVWRVETARSQGDGD